MHEGRVLACGDAAVGQLDGRAAVDALVSLAFHFSLGCGFSRGCHHDVVFRQTEFLHDQLSPLCILAVDQPHRVLAGVTEVAADDLLLSGTADHLVVHYGEAGAIDSHVGG